jgi:hypothetical protein
MVLAPKQTGRPVGQSRRPRDKFVQLEPFDFLTKKPKIYVGGK